MQYRTAWYMLHQIREVLSNGDFKLDRISVWTIIKRGYTGTYHHFSMKHLQRYVDGFTFRLNQGNCEVNTLDCMEAFAKEIGGKRIPDRELVG